MKGIVGPMAKRFEFGGNPDAKGDCWSWPGIFDVIGVGVAVAVGVRGVGGVEAVNAAAIWTNFVLGSCAVLLLGLRPLLRAEPEGEPFVLSRDQ